MKKATQILRTVIIVAMTTVMFSSCVKKEYDDLVTANVDPDITPNMTIAQLQTLATGSTPVEITTDVIVAGIVAGDDLSGNIYKKLILQQDSSGIAVQLDISNFNTEYPTGRHMYVLCKGLFIANNGGNIEVGVNNGSSVGRISAGLAPKYLVKGKWGQYITPKVYTFDNTNIPTNTLVAFNDVQFDQGFNGVAYAASSPANLDLIDCNGNILILYSSTYATFALAKTPYGKGSIAGVYTMYGGQGELQIRDTNDVNMRGLRCDGSTGVPQLITLDSIRLMDPGAANQINLPGDLKIRVTVISNYTTKMLDAGNQNIYVQDSTSGIEMRFDATHSFAVGTQLEVNVSGVELSTYKGVLQLYNVPLGNASVIGTGAITPRTETIDNLLANYAPWEATLVTITGVTITGTGTYNGNFGVNTLTDATGNIELYTASGATFASSAYPTTVVSVTGILTEYDNGTVSTKEILIRSEADVHP